MTTTPLPAAPAAAREHDGDLAVDVTIIGAGPVGLYAAYYAGFRGMSAAVVEALDAPGGQISTLYPEKNVYDVAGFPAVSGRELVERLTTQARQFDQHAWLMGERAELLDREDDRWVITTSERRIRTTSIVVCAGIGSFVPRPLPACKAFLGRGVTYQVGDPAQHAGKDVVVVGGGDSAVDWALALADVARSVTLVHRRTHFRAHGHSLDLLRASSVRLLTEAEVSAAHGEDRVQSVEVTYPGADGPQTETIPCDLVVAALGFTANLGPLASWGMDLDGRAIRTDRFSATSLPGVFAAGDVSGFDGKASLIAVGFGEAATAINNAFIHAHPDASVSPGHSSDQAGGAR
jgi:ferredoxin/flavodoxin---NADP+ reductase